MTAIFEADSLAKHFGAVTALDDVDLQVRPGEVHGLVGENGAGKNTLICIAAGLLQQDDGTLRRGGDPYDPGSHWEANRHGVRVGGLPGLRHPAEQPDHEAPDGVPPLVLRQIRALQLVEVVDGQAAAVGSP